MKMIYCSHKYGGKRKNKRAAEKKIMQLCKQYPQHCFISPIHTFGYLYEALSYKDGMVLCLKLLSKCDELWILSRDSKGVKIERRFAKKNKMPVRELFKKIRGKKMSYLEVLIKILIIFLAVIIIITPVLALAHFGTYFLITGEIFGKILGVIFYIAALALFVLLIYLAQNLRGVINF